MSSPAAGERVEPSNHSDPPMAAVRAPIPPRVAFSDAHRAHNFVFNSSDSTEVGLNVLQVCVNSLHENHVKLFSIPRKFVNNVLGRESSGRLQY
jgi:hypothetical protein